MLVNSPYIPSFLNFVNSVKASLDIFAFLIYCQLSSMINKCAEAFGSLFDPATLSLSR